MPYVELDDGWRAFNRVFLYLYLPETQDEMDALLGPDADADGNRQRAMEAAEDEVGADPQDPYGWFNLGSNLVYFERYGEAADAFDTAINLGLPWRFTRYQFGPYLAYFHQGRFDELVELADYTLFRTNKAGKRTCGAVGPYRLGDRFGAIEDFARVGSHPNYLDAEYALEFVGATP